MKVSPKVQPTIPDFPVTMVPATFSVNLVPEGAAPVPGSTKFLTVSIKSHNGKVFPQVSNSAFTLQAAK